MPRKKINKKPVRTCSICKCAGHNKNTCTKKKSTLNTASVQQPQKPAPKTVRLFVHHLGSEEKLSPHLVNLKTDSIWNEVTTVNPENSDSPLYHFYHELEKTSTQPAKIKPGEVAKSLMVDLSTKEKIKNNPVSQPVLSEKKSKIKIPALVLPKFNIKVNPRAHFNFKELKETIMIGLNTWRDNFQNNLISAFQKTQLRKVAIGALAIIMLLVLPMQAESKYYEIKTNTAQVADAGTKGFMSLQESMSAMMKANLGDAQNSLSSALSNFNNAAEIMNNSNQILQKLVSVVPVVSGQVKSRQNLIYMGQEISLGNTYMLKGLSDDKNSTSTLIAKIESLNSHLQVALPHYQLALGYLNEINTEDLPLEYQAVFNEYRELFTSLINDLVNLNDLGQSLPEIFGGKGMRRYLVVFQNESELRPTGGFIGSFAILDVKDGKIQDITVPPGGSYSLQGQLTEFVEPPAPLLMSNKRWEFQDANWFPSFKDSAQKLLWFFNKSRSLTADGVIAVNSSVLTRLLAVMGPITDENRGLTLTADNAINTIQETVETGTEKSEGKPKQIITDLAGKFSNSFENIDTAQALPILTNLYEALTQKEIQVYFTDETSEQKAENFGWTGSITKTNSDQDYLFVVNTNIQGQKTDSQIEQKIYHETLVQNDGSIIDNVIITRKHNGTAGTNLYGQTNIDYVRVLVPQGSTLISAEGFSWPDDKFFRTPESWYQTDTDLARLEQPVDTDSKTGTKIVNEFEKTSFGNWIITEPGQTSVVKFSYELPFKLSLNEKSSLTDLLLPAEKNMNYSLVLQKQSGNNTNFEGQIIFPDGWVPVWNEGDGMTLAVNGAKININKLKTDKIFSLLVKKSS